MPKEKLAGCLVLGVGGVLGFFLGGATGLGFVAVCLVVGFGLLFSPEAIGISGPRAAPKPRILVLLQEVHARPQMNGKFQEIEAPNQLGLEFEVFVNTWLLNESDVPIALRNAIHLSLRAADGSVRSGERIPGDLDHWRLGSLVRDEWDPDVTRTRQEPIAELSTDKPLECGIPRQGWLHFRLLTVSPAELKKGELRLSIQDSFSNTHAGLATGPVRHVPGRVWPSVTKLPTAVQNERQNGLRMEGQLYLLHPRSDSPSTGGQGKWARGAIMNHIGGS